jgi:hypothetical protein
VRVRRRAITAIVEARAAGRPALFYGDKGCAPGTTGVRVGGMRLIAYRAARPDPGVARPEPERDVEPALAPAENSA